MPLCCSAVSGKTFSLFPGSNIPMTFALLSVENSFSKAVLQWLSMTTGGRNFSAVGMVYQRVSVEVFLGMRKTKRGTDSFKPIELGYIRSFCGSGNTSWSERHITNREPCDD
ncbi:hypothetical protein AVEN_178996-1 [Araneus ventricosus]|uniref:Uncharacterized protein n=1 Tax=Araneus ventricosus TaxID=182803 RepID=A0A4Y2H7X5_ARAVE|nr:hypothetical protein AVEN_178996-1 [Araneus ventricosus]